MVQCYRLMLRTGVTLRSNVLHLVTSSQKHSLLNGVTLQVCTHLKRWFPILPIPVLPLLRGLYDCNIPVLGHLTTKTWMVPPVLQIPVLPVHDGLPDCNTWELEDLSVDSPSYQYQCYHYREVFIVITCALVPFLLQTPVLPYWYLRKFRYPHRPNIGLRFFFKLGQIPGISPRRFVLTWRQIETRNWGTVVAHARANDF